MQEVLSSFFSLLFLFSGYHGIFFTMRIYSLIIITGIGFIGTGGQNPHASIHFVGVGDMVRPSFLQPSHNNIVLRSIII